MDVRRLRLHFVSITMPLKLIKEEADMETTYLGMTIRPEAAYSHGGFDATVTIREGLGNKRF